MSLVILAQLSRDLAICGCGVNELDLVIIPNQHRASSFIVWPE